MFACAGARDCTVSTEKGRPSPSPQDNSNIVSYSDYEQGTPEIVSGIQNRLEELAHKLDKGHSEICTNLENLTQLINVLAQRVERQESLTSSLPNLGELDNTVHDLSHKLQEQEQILQSLRNNATGEAPPQGISSTPPNILKTSSAFDPDITEGHCLKTPSAADPEFMDMKALQLAHAASLQKIADVEQRTLSLKNDLDVIFTKSPQCENFRRTLVENFEFEMEKRLGAIQNPVQKEPYDFTSEPVKWKDSEILEDHVVDVCKDRDPHMNEAANTEGEEGVELEESLWDASILIGWPHLPTIPNIFIMVLVFLNIFGQLVFCIVIDLQFTQSSLPDNDRMVFWRANAHAQDNSDPITGASLVARVCNQDSSLQVADSQVGVVQNADQYQAELLCGPICWKTGPTTFIVAWVLWALVAVHEAIAAMTLLLGVVHIPRGFRTELQLTEEVVEMVLIAWARVFMMVFILTIRLLVCASLFLFGTMWLAYTVNVQNLVLNASALGFVLDMDNLLFDAFMPPVVKTTLKSLKPPPLPHLGKPGSALHFVSYHIGFRPIFSFVVIVGVFIWTWSQQVTEVDQQLTELNETLCSGDVDLIWTTNEALSLMVAHASPAYIEDISEFSYAATYVMTTAQQLWNRTVNPGSEAGQNIDWQGWLTPTVQVYNLFAHSSTEFLTYTGGIGNPSCDSDFWTFESMGLNIYQIRGIKSVSKKPLAVGCSDIIDACGWSNASNLRMLCPSQCGCLLGRSGLYYNGPNKGCPRDKCIGTVAYNSEMATIECEDPSVEELQHNISGWHKYWDQFALAQEELGGIFLITVPSSDGGTRVNARAFADAAKSMGCAGLRVAQAVGAFCYQTSESASIAAFCPVTCGCRRDTSIPGCPHTCTNYNAFYEQALGALPCQDMPSGALDDEGGIWNTWQFAAAIRYQNWYRNDEVQSSVPFFNNMSPPDFWKYVSTNGCEGLDWACDENLGAYNVFTLCADYCLCGSEQSSKFCPTSCTTWT